MIRLFPRVPLVLESTLPAFEIAARIEARVLRVWLFRTGIAGRATPERVKLFAVHRFFHNGYQPVLYARFVSSSSGTRLEGEFRLHAGARLFALFPLLFCFLVLFSIVVGVMPLPPSFELYPFIVFFILLPCSCFGFTWFCWFLSRRDIWRIRAFLTQAVA